MTLTTRQARVLAILTPIAPEPICTLEVSSRYEAALNGVVLPADRAHVHGEGYRCYRTVYPVLRQLERDGLVERVPMFAFGRYPLPSVFWRVVL